MSKNLPFTPVHFAGSCDPRYRGAAHQVSLGLLVANALRRGGARLIVNLPPRHGKSRLLAVETALWQMIRVPGSEVVVASYALDLALRHSREARRRLELETFHDLTLASPRCGHRTADSWALSNGSTFKAVGVGGALTGHGADLLILDDLHKDAAEANSATLRQGLWDWLMPILSLRRPRRPNRRRQRRRFDSLCSVPFAGLFRPHAVPRRPHRHPCKPHRLLLDGWPDTGPDGWVGSDRVSLAGENGVLSDNAYAQL